MIHDAANETGLRPTCVSVAQFTVKQYCTI